MDRTWIRRPNSRLILRLIRLPKGFRQASEANNTPDSGFIGLVRPAKNGHYETINWRHEQMFTWRFCQAFINTGGKRSDGTLMTIVTCGLSQTDKFKFKTTPG
ncbi:hypothetical protein DESC_780146 [Desulfosarcina cetonica]|nr:hypothetical protein DESC_780146 [Desulfosarcina cetonica]